MNIFKQRIIILCIALYITSCAREGVIKEGLPETITGRRIIFVKTLSTLEDFGLKASFFKRLWRAIAGGEEPEFLINPMDIDFFEDKMVSIADSGAGGVHLIDLRVKKYRFITRACGIVLIAPVSCAFVDENTLAISDPQNRLLCLKKLNDSHDVKPEIDFLNPVGIAIDPPGNLFVLDSHLHELFKLSSEGKEIWRKGGRGSKDENLNFPTYLAYHSGKIYVVDTLSYSVKIFSEDGELLSKFGNPGDAPGFFGKPKGIAVDRDGNIHVSDSLFDVVQVFNSEGDFLTLYGGPGEENGKLLHPAGIKIHDGSIYVADSMNSRIEVFNYVE